MSKRGTLWNGEFRYLEHGYGGIIQAQGIANDSVINKARGAYSLAHTQSFGRGFTGSLDLNGASDHTFFSDLGTGSSVIAQTNLLRQGTLAYSGGWWSTSLLMQSYQTLQDPSLPLTGTPYRRLPQITLSANRRDLPLGLNATFSAESVNFQHPDPGTVEAHRLILYPQISLPMMTEAIYVTPKVSLHSTRYALNRPAAGVPEQITRNVPIYSIDSGMTFERTTAIGKAEFFQTLEPRLFYLYVPTRDQSKIPVFDTGATGFGFAQIFAENSYSGGDRVANADQVTAMVTSRFLDAETGAQVFSAGVGQRVYFTTQDVGLPGEVLRTNRESNVLGAVSGFILPKTTVDAGMEYSPRFSRVEVLNVGGRFQPEAGKVLNAGYRYTRDQLAQIDVSGQWPVFNGWHAVGRFNYSTKDNRMIESIAGLEYDGSCWVGRAAFQRLATLTQDSNTSLFFQLEFNGFAKIGVNPLDMLKRSVPGYGIINQQTDPTPTGRTTIIP
jgi:LPS-assembly protein